MDRRWPYGFTARLVRAVCWLSGPCAGWLISGVHGPDFRRPASHRNSASHRWELSPRRESAVLGTLASPGTCISLRVPAQRGFSVEDCVASGSLSPGAAQLLARLIEARLAFLISGRNRLRKMAHMAVVFAELERDFIRMRTREALQVKKENGVTLGRPRSTPDNVVACIVRERTESKTTYAIARDLNKDAVPTAQGACAWSQATVRALLMREGVH